ncbi:unnamed protein product [Dicrocoelium dendriticum]|nr:unnamed protein product [Dicrocoelium dendriticum]
MPVLRKPRLPIYSQNRVDQSNVTCQKCLEKGHWTYMCKGKRKYLERESYTSKLGKRIDSIQQKRPRSATANKYAAFGTFCFLSSRHSSSSSSSSGSSNSSQDDSSESDDDKSEESGSDDTSTDSRCSSATTDSSSEDESNSSSSDSSERSPKMN